MKSRQSDVTRRLMRLYRLASPEQVREGMRWYGRANGIAYNLAAQYGSDPATVARVIAAISPSNPWRNNVKQAEQLLAHYALGGRWGDPGMPGCSTYGENVKKAYRIMAGDASALSGPKVESFAANIMGDHEYVTLDVWALRAALGLGQADWNLAGDRAMPKMTRPRRALIDRAYRSAAKRCGCTPAAFQAIVWVVLKQLDRRAKVLGYAPTSV